MHAYVYHKSLLRIFYSLSSGVHFNEDLLHAMKHSLHPPHVIEYEGDAAEPILVPDGGVPFCWYQGYDDSKVSDEIVSESLTTISG